MKRFSQFGIVAMAFFFAVSSATAATPDPDSPAKAVNWKQYSNALVDGIKSDNLGVRDAAMRLAIQYAGKVDISQASVDLMRIYRDADSDQVRRMAAVTLASIDSDFADGYLRLSAEFERNPAVKQTLQALVAN
ncbi:MAG: hypothetical protein KDD65_07265 [Bacteroidetes bacterium]|nr:hypothetical protein [Bacteroidota bacterium]